MTLRIGVDATCWSNGRGYGRFARELMRAMVALAPEHEFVCFGDRDALAAGPRGAPNLRPVEVAQDVAPVTAARAEGHRSLRDMLRLTRAVWRERPRVFFSPSVYTYFPLPPGQRAVVTVHDAIAERFPRLTLPSRRARLFWALKMRLALRQARLVLTVSEYAAREIAAVHRIRPERIRIALEAPASAYFPAPPAAVEAVRDRFGIPLAAAWFTYVGGFSPHKRVDVLLRAHATIAAEVDPPPHLVLVGRLQGDAFLTTGESLRALVGALGTDQLVHWTGFVPDEDVRGLHTGAVAALLPSEAEGFGLPAVEAAACDTPVIATLASPLPDLLAGGGLFIAPGRVEDLMAAMRELLLHPDRRADLGRTARVRAAALSWEAGARSALAALEEAAA